MPTRKHRAKTARTLIIDYYFLDNQTCTRCRESGAVLDAAITSALQALDGEMVEFERRDHLMVSFDSAEEWGIKASPTIRIGGQDIQPDISFSPCAECGELCDCDGGIDCREWSYGGESYTIAPSALIVEALLAAIREGRFGNPALSPPGTSRELAVFFGRPDHVSSVAEQPAETVRACGCEPACCADEKAAHAT